MKVDRLTITAEITRELGSREEEQLSALYSSGEKTCGIVSLFSWMPFIVTCRTVFETGVTFELRMVNK